MKNKKSKTPLAPIAQVQEEVKWVPIEEVKPNPKNRNKHTLQQVERLSKLLQLYGWRHPIIVSNRTGEIVAGHARLEAAMFMGLLTVPIQMQDFVSEEEEYGFGVSDNAIALWADLDLAGINQDLADLGPDFDIDMLGIKDFVLEPVDKYADKDPDEIPEVTQATCKDGELWILGNHRLLCGDCTVKENVERLMNGEKADMVFTDPPYGVDYQKKCDEIDNQSRSRNSSKIEGDNLSVKELKRLIGNSFSNINRMLSDKSCYYICSPQGGELGLMMMMMMMAENNIPCRHMIIWKKNAPVFSMGRLDYDYQHEPILFGWSPDRTHPKSTQSGSWRSSVWECNREPNKLHPTMKPVALMENAILNSCPPTGKIFDPFSGSGSTLIACEKTNRKCYGMEIDAHYCDVILARWAKFTGKDPVREDGISWRDLNGRQTTQR